MVVASQQPRREIRNAPHFRVMLGSTTLRSGSRAGQRVEFAIDAAGSLNGHLILAGSSGSGKSHQLRRIVRELGRAGVRVHLIDPHGDLHVDPDITDTRVFSEATQAGLNPLEVAADPDHGGPRRAAMTFVSLMLRQATLGEKQRSALLRLLLDLYARYGFEAGNVRSWSLDFDPRDWARAPKRQPVLADLRRDVYQKLVQLKIGVPGSAARVLEDVCKLSKKLSALKVRNLRGDDVEVALDAAKRKFVETIGEAVNRVETGAEIEELIAWDSFDVVKGLYDRLETLEGSGLFKGQAPEFAATRPVWRYDISAISRNEQQFFVECLLGKLFAEAKARGEARGPDTAIVLDEASAFVDKHDEHILNILFREARKFGVMVILASQEIMTFPEAIVSSAASKMILGVDDMYHASLERRLALPKGKLKFIRPTRTALVQTRRRASDELELSAFFEVDIVG
ncbi:MAG: ATP-binding protein [Alphaproteobacteria bacterium]|jgi:DNA helicase HerA-like ATPase|nr:ATP-binding protein [Alphaproteobacteria bacterium]